jgi:hypothetical protein
LTRSWLYLEPVDGASDSVDAEIARLTTASASDGGRP